MIIDDTELNTQKPITEFKPEPTWTETVKASYDNFTSVNLSTSRQDYYKKEMGDNAVKYSSQDPQNTELYNRISKYSYKDIERLEALYEQGNMKAINSYVQQNPFQADIFLSQDFLKYKELQQKNGLKPQSQITEEINARALKEYSESKEVIDRSDHWSAKMIGAMGGVMSDPVTIATLPLGTWKTGASVIGTAARAAGEEMGIEALAQVGIAPEVYGFKKEIGLNTSIMTEAANALISVATAGVFRGVGSAAYDLTAPGLKALRMKDAQLADDYEATFKGSEVSQSNKDFLDDMHKAEFEDPLTMEVSNPSERGMELNSAEPIPQTKPEILAHVEANKIKKEKETLYHTSSVPIEKLDNSKIFWTTEDLQYAGKFGKKDQKITYEISNKEDLKILDTYTEEGKKIIEVANKKAISPMSDPFNPDGGASSFTIQDKKVIDFLKSKGYDAVITSESSRGTLKATGIINTEKVKINKYVKEEANKAKIKSINERIARVKEASEIPIGGSEDEAKQAVKDLFKKPLDADARYKKMSKADIVEIERMQLEQEAMDAFGVTREEMARFNEDHLTMKVGIDEQGEAIHKSFKELQDEHDMTDAYLKKVRDCNL